MSNTVDWGDCTFTVYSPDSRWHAVGGLYIFAGLEKEIAGTPQWRPLYLGKCQDFSTRIPTHEDWPEAVRQGATHIHALVVEDPHLRETLERHLIKLYQPSLNVQGK